MNSNLDSQPFDLTDEDEDDFLKSQPIEPRKSQDFSRKRKLGKKKYFKLNVLNYFCFLFQALISKMPKKIGKVAIDQNVVNIQNMMKKAGLQPFYAKLFSKVFAVNSLADYAQIDEEFLDEVIKDVRAGCLNIIDLEEPKVRKEYLGSASIDYKNYSVKLIDKRKILNLPKTCRAFMKELERA